MNKESGEDSLHGISVNTSSEISLDELQGLQTPTRKKKTTLRQQEIFVEYAKKHLDFSRDFYKPYTKRNKKAWEVLAERLNEEGRGPKRSVKEWQDKFHAWKQELTYKMRNDKTLPPIEKEALCVFGIIKNKKNKQGKKLEKFKNLSPPESIKVFLPEVDVAEIKTEVKEEEFHPESFSIEDQEMSVKDWTMCRLCLQPSGKQLKDFSGSIHKSLSYRNIYSTVTGITLTDYESFPSHICNECDKKMIDAFDFRELCLGTEENLKEMELAKTENVIKIDPDSISPVVENDLVDDDFFENDAFAYDQEDEEDVKEDWKTIPCKRCKISFPDVENLKKHKCSAKGKKGPTVNRKHVDHQCEICGKIMRGYHIAKHQEQHKGIQRFSCEFCDQKFSWYATMRKHIDHVHHNKKSYKCPHCTKEYWTSTTLRVHIRIQHLKKIDHTCDTCGKGFVLKSKLTRHIRQVHSRSVVITTI